MTDMEIYENVDYVQESRDKTNSGPNEYYESLQLKHPKEDTNKVLKCDCNTAPYQICWLLILVLASTSFSIATFILTTPEKSVDGFWSSWTNWEGCSVTCGTGMQTRRRNCSNPFPFGTGRQCLGMDTEVRLCKPELCIMDQNEKAVDGSWSSWTNWKGCSVTCGTGMQTRGRNCSNPSPFGTGRQCLGMDTEVRLCKPEPCRMDQNEIDTYTAFSAYNASYSGGGNNIIFSTVLLNSGRAYNKSNGVFTATFSGLYLFIGHFCVIVSKDADYALKVEGRSVASGEFRTPSDANDAKCTSFSVVAAVQKGEKVWTDCDYLSQSDNDWNYFSGILIHKT